MKKPLFNKFKSKSEDFVKKVNAFNFAELNDEDLKSKLGGSIFEAAAAVKEVIFRLTGLKLFNSQLKTAYGLYSGNICELGTGEGKTLAAVLAAILMRKDNRQVSILVFNDYLASRDSKDNKKVFDFFDISSGCITATSTVSQRKTVYKKDVFYASAKEVGFDFIRNFLATDKKDYLTIPFESCIVDEADSILIDEAGIPLVLAGEAEELQDLSLKAHKAVIKLKPEDYDISLQDNQVWLKDSGAAKIEKRLRIKNLYAEDKIGVLAAVNMALEANFLLTKDKDYIVKDDEIKVIDESTGRIAINRRFEDALHRAVEVKESLKINASSQIYNTITIQSFMENYEFLSGMTGTAKTSKKDFESMYGLDTVVIEPNTPCIRIDKEDRIFKTADEKKHAVLETLKQAYNEGRPVLLGTASVAESEWYSDNLDIPHEVLNARNDEREAEIIADAGLPKRITISTNMAGRGVDIKLGGKKQAHKDEVIETGGLLVVSSGLNRSRRIDNQLRGRSGRQGDPGESIFFISLEDELLAPFIECEENGDMEEYVRDAQKVVEGNQAEARYMLHKYSIILEDQRKVISKFHYDLLFSKEYVGFIKYQHSEIYDELVKEYGKVAVEKAERQLLIYYSIKCFSNYLETMETVKSGIHLTIVGGKNPLDEYNRIAIENYTEMQQDVKENVLADIQRLTITKDGIDMEENGLTASATTWTYLIDDNTSQFSRLPELLKMYSNKVKKAKFSLSRLFEDE